jgi:hypothetical protein
VTLPEVLTRGAPGEIRLTGHRIDLYMIVRLDNEGHAPQMPCEENPSLPLDLIHNVLSFYAENRAEVDTYVAEAKSRIEQFRANYQPGSGIRRVRELMDEQDRAGKRS